MTQISACSCLGFTGLGQLEKFAKKGDTSLYLNFKISKNKIPHNHSIRFISMHTTIGYQRDLEC